MKIEERENYILVRVHTSEQAWPQTVTLNNKNVVVDCLNLDEFSQNLLDWIEALRLSAVSSGHFLAVILEKSKPYRKSIPKDLWAFSEHEAVEALFLFEIEKDLTK